MHRKTTETNTKDHTKDQRSNTEVGNSVEL